MKHLILISVFTFFVISFSNAQINQSKTDIIIDPIAIQLTNTAVSLTDYSSSSAHIAEVISTIGTPKMVVSEEVSITSAAFPFDESRTPAPKKIEYISLNKETQTQGEKKNISETKTALKIK